MVRSTCCSSKRTQVQFPASTLGSSNILVIPVLGESMPSSGFQAHTHTGNKQINKSLETISCKIAQEKI